MSNDIRQADRQIIPGYVLHEVLDRDLVGTTHLAERESDGYPVFVHVVPEQADDGPAFDALLETLRRVGEIKHPVLPDVWDAGRADGRLFVVTTAVEGRSLAETLRAEGRLSMEDTLAVCSELADTLDTLHAADLIHGAINPHTVWINDRSQAPSAPWVTLRGHGIAQVLTRRISIDRLDPPPDEILYVAPEQLRHEELTGRIDQYALACMVVHCLTGTPPFERSTINALVGAHLFAAPHTADMLADVHPQVAEAVDIAMAKDPADRYPLCAAFATAIGGDARRSWSWMIEEALSAEALGEQDETDTGDGTDETADIATGRSPDRGDPSRDTAPAAGATTHDDGPDRARASAGDGAPTPGKPPAGSAGPAVNGVSGLRSAAAPGGPGQPGGGGRRDRHHGPGREARRRDHAAAMRFAEADWLPGGSDDLETAEWLRPTTATRPGTGEAGSHGANRGLSDALSAGDGAGRRRMGGDGGMRWRPGTPGPAAGGMVGRGASAPTSSTRMSAGAAAAGLPEARRRRRGPSRTTLWWIAATILAAAVVVALIVLQRPQPEAASEPAPDTQRAERTPEEVSPVWERTISSQRVTALLDTGNVLVSGAGDSVNGIDPASGRVLWRAAVDHRVADLTAADGVVVLRTARALLGYDEQTGRRLWDTSNEDGAAPLALATGRSAIYEVTTDDGDTVVHARDVRTGKIRWTIEGLAGEDDEVAAVYDRSAKGEQMLYVLGGERLHAIDTARQRERWSIGLDRPEVGSLTAVARAIVVTTADGQICRYGMEDGNQVWTRCARLESAPGTRAAIQTRNARVIVRSAREVAAVDFTSGVAHWSVADPDGFLDAFAANARNVFVTHADGSIQAIDHQRGQRRWRSRPLGDVTAMAATGDDVYVATADGTVRRFDAVDGVPES